ncbi:hypothetical protein SS50377_23265 [Spironucleus salmonicida]|uniref:Uncharacterized protein n=1 Tax=Spironucleus salmonicida TaxID=348837 RepID=A0A9P8LWN1_9EUKA|nr:hypothetical protein SS50377_23265 [Spironucleus salmonicida]
MIKNIHLLKVVACCKINISLSEINEYIDSLEMQQNNQQILFQIINKWVTDNGSLANGVILINNEYRQRFLKISLLNLQQVLIYDQVSRNCFRGIKLTEIKGEQKKQVNMHLDYLLKFNHIIQYNQIYYNAQLSRQEFDACLFHFTTSKYFSLTPVFSLLIQLRLLRTEIINLFLTQCLVLQNCQIYGALSYDKQMINKVLEHLCKLNILQECKFKSSRFLRYINADHLVQSRIQPLTPVYSLKIKEDSNLIQSLFLSSKNIKQYIGFQLPWFYCQKKQEWVPQQPSIQNETDTQLDDISNIQQQSIINDPGCSFNQFQMNYLVFVISKTMQMNISNITTQIIQLGSIIKNIQLLEYLINKSLNFLVIFKYIIIENDLIWCRDSIQQDVLNLQRNNNSCVPNQQDTYIKTYYFIENNVNRTLYLLKVLIQITNNQIYQTLNVGFISVDQMIMQFTVRQLLKLVKDFGVQFESVFYDLQNDQKFDCQLIYLSEDIFKQFIGNKLGKVKQSISAQLKVLENAGYITEVSLQLAFKPHYYKKLSYLQKNKQVYVINTPYYLNVEILSAYIFADNGISQYLKDLSYLQYDNISYFCSINYNYEQQDLIIPFLLVQDFIFRLRSFHDIKDINITKFLLQKPEVDYNILKEIIIDRTFIQTNSKLHEFIKNYAIPQLSILILIKKLILSSPNKCIAIENTFQEFITQQQINFTIQQFLAYSIYSIITFNIKSKIFIYKKQRYIPYTIVPLNLVYPKFAYQKRSYKFQQSILSIRNDIVTNIQQTYQQQSPFFKDQLIINENLNTLEQQINLDQSSKIIQASNYVNLRYSDKQSMAYYQFFNKVLQYYILQDEIVDNQLFLFCQKYNLNNNKQIATLYSQNSHIQKQVNNSSQLATFIYYTDNQRDNFEDDICMFDNYPFQISDNIKYNKTSSYKGISTSLHSIQTDISIISEYDEFFENPISSCNKPQIIRIEQKSILDSESFENQTQVTHIYPTQKSNQLVSYFIQLCKNQTEQQIFKQFLTIQKKKDYIKYSDLNPEQKFIAKLGYFNQHSNTNELLLYSREIVLQTTTLDAQLIQQLRKDISMFIYINPGISVKKLFNNFHPLLPSIIIRILNILSYDFLVEIRSNNKSILSLSGAVSEDLYTLKALFLTPNQFEQSCKFY